MLSASVAAARRAPGEAPGPNAVWIASIQGRGVRAGRRGGRDSPCGFRRAKIAGMRSMTSERDIPLRKDGS